MGRETVSEVNGDDIAYLNKQTGHYLISVICGWKCKGCEYCKIDATQCRSCHGTVNLNMPTECPRKPMKVFEADGVRDKILDFTNGKWFTP